MEEELIEKASKQVSSFFNDEVPEFKISFLKTREEMDKIWKRPTPAWVVAKTGNDNDISIFEEDVFERVSHHPKEDFPKVLAHEITHIYTKSKFNLTFPMWLNEGIAYVVADQDKKTGEKKDIRQAHTFEEWNKNPVYGASGKFVRYLIEKFGKEKLIDLLKEIKENEKKETFKAKFKQTFGEDFDSLVGSWLNL